MCSFLSPCCFGACRSPCFIPWLSCQCWNLLQAWCPSWQQVHLHSSASSLALTCGFCTDSGLFLIDNLWREMLVRRSFAFKKCSFFLPSTPLFFISFLVVFLLLSQCSAIAPGILHRPFFHATPKCFNFRLLAF